MTVTEEHVTAIQKASSRFVQRLPQGADEDAVRGAAMEALAKAALSYDGRGNFTQRAVQLAWFAMIDEVRRLTPDTRGQHQARKQGKPAVMHGREVFHVRFSSFDATLTDDGVTLADVVADPVDDFAEVDLADMRRRKLSTLTAREQFVLLARGYGYGLEELGAMLGVSTSRVSQIASGAVSRVAA